MLPAIIIGGGHNGSRPDEKKDRGICLPGLFGHCQDVVRAGAVGAGFNPPLRR
jgi:hypothetical protein